MKYTEQDVTDNMGLVFTMAKGMRNLERTGVMEFQDLINEGVLGLIHALDRFDESKGFKFSSYACQCISGYMFRGHRNLHMEKWKAKQSRLDVPSTTIPMFQPFLDSDEVREVVGCDDRGINAENMFDTVANKCFWDKILPQLAPRQRQVLSMLRDGLTPIQIAPLLGVSRQCVNQTKLLAIERTRRIISRKKKGTQHDPHSPSDLFCR